MALNGIIGIDEIKVSKRKFNIAHLLIFLHEGMREFLLKWPPEQPLIQFNFQLSSGLRLNSWAVF